MHVYARVKAIARKRDVFDEIKFEVKDEISTANELIEEVVKINVKIYNEKPIDTPFFLI